MEKIKKIKKIICNRYFIMVVLFIIATLTMYQRRNLFLSPILVDYNQTNDSTVEIPIENNTIEQIITLKHDITGLDVLMGNYSAADNTVELTIVDHASGDILSSAEAVVPASEGEIEVVHFDIATEGIKENQEIGLVFSYVEGAQAYYSVSEGEFEEVFFNNGQECDYRLRMSVSCGYYMHKGLFLIVVLVLYACIGLFFIPKKFDKYNKLENKFLVVAVAGGVMIAALNPAFQECDGWDHFIRAMDVSYGNVLGSFVNLTHERGQVIVPDNISELNYRIITVGGHEGTDYNLNLMENYFSNNAVLVEYSGDVTSVYYWPQGLGLFIGRILNCNMYWSIMLMKLFNLMAYVIVTFFAIKLIPVYRNLLTVIALMPITLHQAASSSPDALLNSFCFLFIALCFRYAYDESAKLTLKRAFGLGALLAVIFMCKYIYVFVGLLVFMIPIRKVGEKKEYAKAFVIALIPLIVIGGLIGTRMLSGLATMTATASNGGMTQTQYLMANPGHYFAVLLHTVMSYFYYYNQTLGTLGSLGYNLTFLWPVIPALLMGTAVLDVNNNTVKMTIKDKLLCFGAFILSSAGVLTALLVGDGRINGVGCDIVIGVQGRYFIPVLLLLMLCFSSKNVKHEIKNFSNKLLLVNMFMLFYSAMMLLTYCYR